MGKYAENTSVSADRSRAEIERTLERYGADQFVYGWDKLMNAAVIQFRISSRLIKFILPMPDPEDSEFTSTPSGRKRHSPEQAHRAWEKATRQRWRALSLVIKAKLEAVDTGITTIEEEFLAQTVLPNNKTVGEFMRPQLKEIYETGSMPAMLPDFTGKE